MGWMLRDAGFELSLGRIPGRQSSAADRGAARCRATGIVGDNHAAVKRLASTVQEGCSTSFPRTRESRVGETGVIPAHAGIQGAACQASTSDDVAASFPRTRNSGVIPAHAGIQSTRESRVRGNPEYAGIQGPPM